MGEEELTQRESKCGRKKPGRPRKSGKVSIDQKREILDAALDLFQRNGYENVSMVSISRAAGMSQSSLYYWFKSKDDIFKTLVKTNNVSLRKAYEAYDSTDDTALCLYKVLYADAKNLCDLSFDYILVENIARGQREEFGEFFEAYKELHDLVESLISQGVEQGVFSTADPCSAAAFALATNEGFQHRYLANGPSAARLLQHPVLVKCDSGQVAHEAAARTLSLLLDVEGFEALLKAVAQIGEAQP